MLQTRFGKAKPAGFHNLAQDTPQPCLDARNFFLTAAHSRLDGFHKYRNKEKSLSNPIKPDDPNYQQDSAARWTMNSYVKFGSLNCRGLASEHSATKKEVLVHSMRKLGLDMFFLQETHINTNSTETIEGFCFIYATSITDAQREQADKTRAENTARGRQRNGARHAPPIDIEHGGTGVILSPKAKATLLDFKQIDGRIMTVTLNMIGPPLHFLNAYAPQSGTETRLKNDFYETLERNLVSFPNSHPTFIVGDFNARLHARFENEACCIGQHIFGRGLNFLIHNSSPASFENRSLFVEFCLAHDLHIGNTLFQKPVKAGDLQRSWCARWTSLVPG